jgi:hypothetical protein
VKLDLTRTLNVNSIHGTDKHIQNSERKITERKTQYGRLRCRWENNARMDLKGTE